MQLLKYTSAWCVQSHACHIKIEIKSASVEQIQLSHKYNIFYSTNKPTKKRKNKMSKNVTVIATNVESDSISSNQNKYNDNNPNNNKTRKNIQDIFQSSTLKNNKNTTNDSDLSETVKDTSSNCYSNSTTTTNTTYNSNAGATVAYNNTGISRSSGNNNYVIINKSLDCSDTANVWMDYKKLKTYLIFKDKQCEKVILAFCIFFYLKPKKKKCQIKCTVVC